MHTFSPSTPKQRQITEFKASQVYKGSPGQLRLVTLRNPDLKTHTHTNQKPKKLLQYMKFCFIRLHPHTKGGDGMGGGLHKPSWMLESFSLLLFRGHLDQTDQN